MIRKIVMKNLACPDCIAKIERRTARLPYVNTASFNQTNHVLLVDFKHDYPQEKALREIRAIVHILDDTISVYDIEDAPETNHSTPFWKAYGLVLLGGALILFTFVGHRIFPFINQLFDTDYTSLEREASAILYWIGYVFLISRLLVGQIKGIRHFNLFNENTLMIIATLAAMALGKFEESIAVVILYSVGEHLQHRAVDRSRSEISALVDIKVDYANVRENGNVVLKDPLEINIGDHVVVKNGEKIPVDGVVIEGSTSLDTSHLTGESKLKGVDVGDAVLSGNINVGTVITVRAEKEYSDSTLAKIIDLIEHSDQKKSKIEMFITKFARIYTPIVVGLALLLIGYGALVNPGAIDEYIYSAAIFLVISCPCSLVLSIPLTYYAGIGKAARNGILFKGSTYLHALNDVETIALDKTGTLTHGDFFVRSHTDDEVLRLAASLEQYSTHPIAKAIISANSRALDELTEIEEIPGYGIKGSLDGDTLYAGNSSFLERYGIRVNEEKLPVGSYTYVARNKEYLGYIVVGDKLKETSMDTVRHFTRYYDTVVLTGDNEDSAHDIAMQLGGIEYYAEMLPEEKLQKFNEIRTHSLSLYVGDGINDAPLLKNADIAVSMGSASDLAIEVSDVIIINDDLRLLEKGFRISQKTRRIAIQNIVFSLVVKVVFLTLSALGYMWMWLAIFADVGVALLCVLNALRVIYQNKYLSHAGTVDG